MAFRQFCAVMVCIGQCKTGSITLHRVLRCQALLCGCGRHEEVISICLLLIDLVGAKYLAVILVCQGRSRPFLREWCHICSMLVLQPSAIYLNPDQGLLFGDGSLS